MDFPEALHYIFYIILQSCPNFPRSQYGYYTGYYGYLTKYTLYSKLKLN